MNVGAKGFGAGDRRHLINIDPNHDAAAAFGTDPLDRYLRPSSRRAAEIENPPAGPEQTKTLIQFDQLEGGARAISEAPGLGDIGIVELPRQPRGRGRLAPARAAEPHRHVRPASGRTG